MLKIVVSLGGNALQKNPKDKSAEAQLKTCKDTAKSIVDLIEDGNEIIITHGNGPQIGQIIFAYEKAQREDELNHVMPFPECGAMSQGYIGYHLQQALKQELKRRGISKQVATVITQVVVDKDDSGFKNPTKPIGSFFTRKQAEKLMKDNGYSMKEDAGRGWRRVVASPMPKSIVEDEIIKTLVKSGHVVITVGGGGVPVIEKDGDTIEGVAAVIDKDFASEKIAEIIDADILLILTAVEKVAINFNKGNQKDLLQMDTEDAHKYIDEGQFAPGSMLPKVRAAVMFAESKKGRRTIITSLEKVKEALHGKTGTVITNKQ
ncbi:carbamate kinase [Clostridium autoethanogenum]|uniref:Carbamate kinase n=1 Tax=Clostridium autoethanogenum DSM 10061 TaxID=1341692 RepID=A0ABM5NQU8_9CLOT|nr:carbamate kinase [Clostridium autoethanogenum]AGY74650.1 carbamate kinase [Clostridium autoethanogenum DSM 10061]ALU34832.1 Aspartate/glutamate/uridylate kinase [Clostridium autoethanogenum DSM 10061]OVY51553.1 Carbamate kinase 1 [Clostridium autoethanogenum]